MFKIFSFQKIFSGHFRPCGIIYLQIFLKHLWHVKHSHSVLRKCSSSYRIFLAYIIVFTVLVLVLRTKRTFLSKRYSRTLSSYCQKKKTGNTWHVEHLLVFALWRDPVHISSRARFWQSVPENIWYRTRSVNDGWSGHVSTRQFYNLTALKRTALVTSHTCPTELAWPTLRFVLFPTRYICFV